MKYLNVVLYAHYYHCACLRDWITRVVSYIITIRRHMVQLPENTFYAANQHYERTFKGTLKLSKQSIWWAIARDKHSGSFIKWKYE
jgi:hypothetical protein